MCIYIHREQREREREQVETKERAMPLNKTRGYDEGVGTNMNLACLI